MKKVGQRTNRYLLAVLWFLAVNMASIVSPLFRVPARNPSRMRRRALLREFLRTGEPSSPRFRSLVPAGAMARYSERNAIVFCKKPADGGGAVSTLESINMGKLRRVMFIIQFGTITGNPVFTLKSGATDGTQTTAETFRYRLADADQGGADADQFGDWATSSSLTMTGSTYDNRVTIIEIDADELTDGQPWLTGEFSNVTALNHAVVAIGEPHFEANDVPTVI